MNDLDRQLAKLALMNQTDLAPSPSSGTSGKKIAPAVPPKPKKTQPQIPQSYPLKQTVEPSYSARLQSTQFYSNIPPPSQSHYSNAPVLSSNAKYHPSDGNYANLPRQSTHDESRFSISDQSSQYSNLPRSNSAMSNTSSLPRGASYSPKPVEANMVRKQYNMPRQSMGTPVGTSGPKGYGGKSDVTYSNIQVGKSRNQDGLIYSNLVHPPSKQRGGMYSNIPAGAGGFPNGEDLPPPPPPPIEMTAGLADYAACTVNTNLPPPPEDMLPPPSPVSSSYSELRRATQPGQDFHNYSMDSQFDDTSSLDSLCWYGTLSEASSASSTYESIYEPINPRPPSQMSSRSNYSLYAPYVSGTSSVMTGPSISVSRIGHNKEQEVDSLTDLLVQGMGGRTPELDQEDVYGVCVKCGLQIIGENSGCTAMNQLYHVKCFTCHHCAINLQGKPFYALQGYPYCEEDYLNTLEKCCVCQKPILVRILRATGKPYHPSCFCCVVCNKSLDGIPFTVDAMNRVHCIEDFHKMFAPRCWVCKQPIMPEEGEEETVRVVALDHSFHIQCYKCEDCGLVLSSEQEGRGCYPLDDHVLCKSCNAKRVQILTSQMTTEL